MDLGNDIGAGENEEIVVALKLGRVVLEFFLCNDPHSLDMSFGKKFRWRNVDRKQGDEHQIFRVRRIEEEKSTYCGNHRP
jgi:hypothetical protein